MISPPLDYPSSPIYRIWQAFDPSSEEFGHGNNKLGQTKASILHPDLKTIPRQPQVQLIGNGVVHNHEGLTKVWLKHPTHKTFHKTQVCAEDEEKGATRFFRWHMDAALYDLSPPKVTTLYAISVPRGPEQTCRYDDGTGDELKLPLGTTVFVSGRIMFGVLSKEMKSLAVRTQVKVRLNGRRGRLILKSGQYAPHPYIWMARAHAVPTGLGLESEGLERPLDQLPPWDESKIKTYPLVSVKFFYFPL